MDKILLTGANGFLGRTIAKTLQDNFKIFSLSRKRGDYKISLDKEIPLFNQKFDLVIHSAGKAHVVPKTAHEKKQFNDVNVVGTANLLKGLEQSGIPKQFVFISSVSVYGKEEGTLIAENSILGATDAYGLSKIAAEKLIADWCQKKQVVCTILRLPLLVGAHPPGNLGSMIKAIGKGYYFNIGGGLAKKSMVVAEDVARFIPKVASIGGIYNLTDGQHPSFKELSYAIAIKLGKTEPKNLSLFVAKPMGYVGDLLGNKAPINSKKIKKVTADLTFDDTKARNVFGWDPQNVLRYFESEP
ncbi:NAD-dependent epimerase/dehydratase family protein [Flavobacterium nackdongense]|uniref:NAD-dependent epimerase/dehydratase family protein n=1 Tax=Flavobacterium nackdongense TaxID=2547394 RepID=A0A4P6YH40_9FLAO|nr:NAD-dependent epimerase/dehydratase family protein [Flavobacterium nackdongense]QBN19803.1 NAD-dependent epimerase/dehydratase family protein [Flavobacterium nackdongense]